MRIGIIGAGYVGLVSGAGFALNGHKVKCADISRERVELINSGKSPIYEDGLEEVISRFVPSLLSATTSAAEVVLESKVILICVGTPSKKNGEPDLSALKECAREIGKALAKKKDYCVIAVKSTVLPGVTEGVVLPVLESASQKKAGADFGLCMNPEFLKEGVALKDFLEPDRIVIGCIDSRTESVMRGIYSGFNAPILAMKPCDAEMTKIASNCFLATKISFMNELANLSKKLGVDIEAVAKGMGSDRRIAPYFLKPGPGFGGSCFPKDLRALKSIARKLGEKMAVISATIKANDSQPMRLVELAAAKIDLKSAKVGVLGLAFKPNTDDVRESPAIPIISALLSAAKEVNAFDPKAEKNMRRIFPQANYFPSAQEVIRNSDIVLIVTDWPEFSEPDYGSKIVVDARNVFEGKKKPENYECLVK